MAQFNLQPAGDTGVRVCFKGEVSPELNNTIKNFCNQLKTSNIKGVKEWVPAYKTLSIYYSPDQISYSSLCERLTSFSPEEMKVENRAKVVTIPTWYGGAAGPDLAAVANHNKLSEKDVVEIHSSKNYLVYMMGFLPGFPYLGGMSHRITAPRLENPRANVAAGSVGIAGRQTGIYPLQSPGGWNIIGRTPVKLFDLSREEPFLFQSGDWIRFDAITQKEYDTIALKIENNTFQIQQKLK